jgi:subtilisin
MRGRKSRRSAEISGSGRSEGNGAPAGGIRAGLTGRYLVVFREGATEAGTKSFRSAGLKVKSAAAAEGVSLRSLKEGEGAVVLDKLGVAVVSGEPARIRSLGKDKTDPILAIEPEHIVYALNARGAGTLELAVPPQITGTQYLRGYRDAVNQLVDNIITTNGQTPESEEQLMAMDVRRATWGLSATKVMHSDHTGRGIRVAVLDTGFDLEHPDFNGRNIVTESFVEGEQVQDGNGHGTHCIGTSCGPRAPEVLPRYGIAYEAEIYAGKVLSNEGIGDDGGILAGIEWAVTNGCAVISMSLGYETAIGEPFSQVYEIAAQRALAAGTLIIAAAGNESLRPQLISPVGGPANCPSIMAVGAVSRRYNIADFSNGGRTPDGGQVDIVGPGVDVYSAWPMPRRYRTISGTSMATPHVAGIAALYAEAKGARGSQLWTLLTQNARRLNLPARDVGAGIVQAL